MKTTIKTITICAILGAMAFVGCKKYPEGPALSLVSKKSRLANDWKLDKYLVNGVDQTASLAGSTTTKTIDKSGTYTYTQTSSLGTFSDAGKWEFIEKKEELKSTSNTAGATADTSVILKLKSKELWLIDKSGTNKAETHYVPK